MFEYDNQLLRRDQAARFLQVSERTLDRLMASKSIPYIKLRNNVYFLESDLEAFLEASKILPEDPKRLDALDRSRIQALEKKLDSLISQRQVIEAMKEDELAWFSLSEKERARFEKALEILSKRSNDVFQKIRNLDAGIQQRKKRLERGTSQLEQKISEEGTGQEAIR